MSVKRILKCIKNVKRFNLNIDMVNYTSKLITMLLPINVEIIKYAIKKKVSV